MNQDFLNENKEEQKTEQTPTQTENKETAPQAVPAVSYTHLSMHL